MTTAPNAIGYLRFSTAEQKKGGSAERQDDGITTYCARKGWNLTEIRAEEGKSGFHGHHRKEAAQLGQFEREALLGEHDGTILVVERLDRLGRETPQKTWALICKLSDAGVSIATIINDKFYPARAELPMFDMLEILFTAWGNNQESAKKSAHIAYQWEQRRKRAKEGKLALTRLVPEWLTVNKDRTISVIPERAALVLRWFELADQGIGAQRIGAILDKEGIPTWERKGKSRRSRIWGRTFIARTLSDRRVIGEFIPHVLDENQRRVPLEVWENHFPAIVPADLFARVSGAANDRKTGARAMNSVKVTNLLSGLVHCKECGSTLRYVTGRREGANFTLRSGKRYSYKRGNGSLVCPVGISGSPACSNRRYLAYLTFEDAVLDSCLHLALDDTAFSNKGEVGRLNVTIAEREQSHRNATERALKLWEAWSNGGSEMAMTLAQQAEAEAKEIGENIIALKRQREQARGRADSAAHLKRVADVRDNLYHRDLERRRTIRQKVSQALRGLIERIEYDGEGCAIRFIAGAASVYIDRKGKLGMTFDFIKEGRADPPRLDDYKRRRKAALSDGDLFRRSA
ncbi:MAG TPA: recombinase family protein [Allosphingosinicella sp.]|nr:recombinase family protein [Allosphingosinicella sp.]